MNQILITDATYEAAEKIRAENAELAAQDSDLGFEEFRGRTRSRTHFSFASVHAEIAARLIRPMNILQIQ